MVKNCVMLYNENVTGGPVSSYLLFCKRGKEKKSFACCCCCCCDYSGGVTARRPLINPKNGGGGGEFVGVGVGWSKGCKYFGSMFLAEFADQLYRLQATIWKVVLLTPLESKNLPERANISLGFWLLYSQKSKKTLDNSCSKLSNFSLGYKLQLKEFWATSEYFWWNWIHRRRSESLKHTF